MLQRFLVHYKNNTVSTLLVLRGTNRNSSDISTQDTQDTGYNMFQIVLLVKVEALHCLPCA